MLGVYKFLSAINLIVKIKIKIHIKCIRQKCNTKSFFNSDKINSLWSHGPSAGVEDYTISVTSIGLLITSEEIFSLALDGAL